MNEDTSRKVFLGLPAFNEEEAIEPLFTRVRQARKHIVDSGLAQDLNIIFYDDGSTDQTAKAVRENFGDLPITMLTPQCNGGLGRALQGIFSFFLENASQEDVLVIMDTDDTHDPAQIIDLLQRMDTHGEDVVIASRYQKGARTSGVPAHRQMLSLGFASLVSVLLPISGVRDYSCGYRAYTYSALASATSPDGFILSEPGFSAMPEVLVRLRRNQLKFGEIPLRLSYDRRLTESKMRAWQNTTRLLKCITMWRLSPAQSLRTHKSESSVLAKVHVEELTESG